MKKKFIIGLCFTVALCLCAAIPLFGQTAYAYTVAEIPETDDFPIVGYTEGVSSYSDNTALTYYTGEEAAEAEVPEGYTGSVLKITNANPNAKYKDRVGVTLDYSEKNIPVRLINSAKFRVYCYATVNEVRITNSDGSAWQLRYAVPAGEKNAWIEVSLGKTQLSTLANESGVLGIFELGFRLLNGNDFTAYLDEITFEFAPDSAAPVINFEGDSATVTEGKRIETALNVTAYDNEEERNVKVEYVWESDDAVDGEGNVKTGTHTLTLKATDLSGNEAQKTITVTVKERDKIAPVISFPGGNITAVNAVTGTYPLIYGTATDNEDEVEIEYSWSDNALDGSGRLTQGTHTLTLSATDASGNSTSVTVTFNVYETESEFLVLKQYN